MSNNTQTQALATMRMQLATYDTTETRAAVSANMASRADCRRALACHLAAVHNCQQAINQRANPASHQVPVAHTLWQRTTATSPWYFVKWEGTAGPLLPQVLELQTWPEYFEEIWLGRSPFIVRWNDKGYQAGDVLQLREYVAPTSERPGRYTGRELTAQVTQLLGHEDAAGEPTNGPGPLAPGWVVLGIELQ